MTATCATAGWDATAFSTSVEDTFSPPSLSCPSRDPRGTGTTLVEVARVAAVVPAAAVLFGRGLRQFDLLPARIDLEIAGVIDAPEAACMAASGGSLSSDTAGADPEASRHEHDPHGIRPILYGAKRSTGLAMPLGLAQSPSGSSS